MACCDITLNETRQRRRVRRHHSCHLARDALCVFDAMLDATPGGLHEPVPVAGVDRIVVRLVRSWTPGAAAVTLYRGQRLLTISSLLRQSRFRPEFRGGWVFVTATWHTAGHGRRGIGAALMEGRPWPVSQ